MRLVGAVLALMMVLAGRATAQNGRNVLQLGGEAYDVAEYRAALPLLVVGLNPAAGPRDTLWVTSVHRLAHILIEEGRDSLATVWLRWALRLQPGLVVDTVEFPPVVQDAFALARAFVAAEGPRDTLVETTWEWTHIPAEATEGAVRIERSGVMVSGFIKGVGPVLAETSQALPPGSYTFVASVPGYFRTQVTREVLPGVTTVLRFRIRGVSTRPLGFLYVASRPWGSISLDGEPLGPTPVAAAPLPA
ncbi:MAG TPA: hypothetical protein VE714_01195, partial [Gemmatimonadales bacterium]|nr:hypothetical protein [Gemmatimonadales bacterium]